MSESKTHTRLYWMNEVINKLIDARVISPLLRGYSYKIAFDYWEETYNVYGE